MGATYYPPPARSRASPKVGPPILSHPPSHRGGHLRPRPQAERGTATRIAARGEGAHHARGDKQQRRRYNIATSRTGTGKWKRVRAQALKQAIDNGVHNCPICGVGLDYEYSQRPSSAEVDHLVPYSKGGTDTLGNTTVICRWCNQRKGNGRNLTVPTPKTIEPGTSIEW